MTKVRTARDLCRNCRHHLGVPVPDKYGAGSEYEVEESLLISCPNKGTYASVNEKIGHVQCTVESGWSRAKRPNTAAGKMCSGKLKQSGRFNTSHSKARFLRHLR